MKSNASNKQQLYKPLLLGAVEVEQWLYVYGFTWRYNEIGLQRYTPSHATLRKVLHITLLRSLSSLSQISSLLTRRDRRSPTTCYCSYADFILHYFVYIW
ncbi:hypothetical protein QVD17_15095 [Tagetes erecta]|uniref:Uncharacterized protein n=1 Tax=Tagetes erecta TaxID=13708 RepID=A0AAD8NZD9_TARER|nr:hypothetical protein QVD17_15095 [Tagetes erecta]